MLPDYKTIGLRLAQARKKVNLKQKDIAALIGATVGYATSIENGKKPSIEYLMEAASACNVSIDWILTGKTNNNSDLNPELQTVLDIYSSASQDMKPLIINVMETMVNSTSSKKQQPVFTLTQYDYLSQKDDIT